VKRLAGNPRLDYTLLRFVYPLRRRQGRPDVRRELIGRHRRRGSPEISKSRDFQIETADIDDAADDEITAAALAEDVLASNRFLCHLPEQKRPPWCRVSALIRRRCKRAI